jgi:type VI secretion system protein ImpM
MPVAEMSPQAVTAATAGFWGKIPARGDFVGIGLPPALVAAWDGWISRGVAAGRERLGETWLPAWMEAPVWCFTAGPGLFGAGAAAGLWMPSVDRAGRAFPLLIATLGGADPGWFVAAERAGRAALTDLLDPEALAARIAAPGEGAVAGAGSEWWTEGAPRVAPCRIGFDELPDIDDFVRMLDDDA